MKAAILNAFGKPLSIMEVPTPSPGPNEVLVKVMASGLCLTDVHIRDGIIPSIELPRIPGHEMAGIVAELGSGVEGLRLGQRVICAIDVVCGKCALCQMGSENLCRSRVRIGFERDGSHAEYAVAPSANLFPIADHVPFDQACVIPDAVACMYHAIMDVGRVCRGERVLIYGVGGLGLQGVQILKHLGADVFAASRTQAKLDMARSLGAHHTISTATQDLKDAIAAITEEQMCDVAFDLVGNDHSMELLLNCIRPGGRVVALAYASKHFYGNYQELVIKEKQILGVRGSTQRNMADCIRLVEAGIITPCISRHYRLDQINEALRALEAGKSLGRSTIVFDD